MNDETADAVWHGVESGLDDGALPEALEVSLVRELDLEQASPLVMLPFPVQRALFETGFGDDVTKGVDPVPRRKGSVENLDREPLGHGAKITAFV